MTGFAGDDTLLKYFKPQRMFEELNCLIQLEDLMEKFVSWMDTLHLKIKPSMTELIYFGSMNNLNRCQEMGMQVKETLIQRTRATNCLEWCSMKQLHLKIMLNLNAERQWQIWREYAV